MSYFGELGPEGLGAVLTAESRAKKKLLGYYPDMRAQSDGRDVLLVFDNNLVAALSRACAGDMDEDAMHVIRAAINNCK